MMELETLQRTIDGFFPGHLGVKLVEAGADRVVGTLDARDEHCTVPGVVHGGAIMGLADTLGGVAAFLNLPTGASTSTLESKTNFLGAARPGTTIRAECTPLRKGKRTMVWETRLTDENDRPLAIVTQTQMVLEGPRAPAEVMTSLFAGKSIGEQRALLATLERAGAGLYRAWAEAEADPAEQERLLAAAEREEENARVLERASSNGASETA